VSLKLAVVCFPLPKTNRRLFSLYIIINTRIIGIIVIVRRNRLHSKKGFREIIIRDPFVLSFVVCYIRAPCLNRSTGFFLRFT